MKNILLTLGLVTTALFAVTSPVFAGTTNYGDSKVVCSPVYGGNECPTDQLIIDKKVADPITTSTKGGTTTLTFKDNLGVNDAKYGATQKITFEIAVTNTSDKQLTNVTVKDVLPQFVNINVADNKNWSFDKNTNTLSLVIDTINAKETKKYQVVGTISELNQLPADQEVTCVINQAFASTANVSAQDNAQFCIEKKVLGFPVHPAPKAQQTPPTGAGALLALIPAGLSGLLIRKRALK